VRSEKEIKEEIEKYGSAEGNVKDLYGWVLEGKPRYSVAEIEKIIKWCVENEGFGPPMEDWILEVFKDSKEVEEILNEKVNF